MVGAGESNGQEGGPFFGHGVASWSWPRATTQAPFLALFCVNSPFFRSGKYAKKSANFFFSHVRLRPLEASSGREVYAPLSRKVCSNLHEIIFRGRPRNIDKAPMIDATFLCGVLTS